MAHKVIDGDKLDNEMRITADAIRQKLGVPDQLQWKDNSGFASDVDRIVIKSGGYEQGYEDGKNSVEQYSRYANTIKFPGLSTFTTPEVELTFDKLLQTMDMFKVTTEDQRNTVVEHLTLNIGSVSGMASSMFECNYNYRDLVLKRLTLNFSFANCTRLQGAFNCQTALEVIDGTPLDLSGIDTSYQYCLNNMFNYCNGLKEIRFAEKTIPYQIEFGGCSKLSDESIQSIVDGLKDLTGGTAQTLRLHATVGNKLTNEQKATITAKNWTLVY